MAQIGWRNQHRQDDPSDDRCTIVPEREKLSLDYEDFVAEGFRYVSSGNLHYDFKEVLLPSKDTLSLSDIEKILSEKLVTGNTRQLEALRSLEFLKLAEMFEPWLYD